MEYILEAEEEGERKVLIIPIEKKWFDMVERREKKEEYREDKPYWRSRFIKLMTGVDMIGKHHKALLRNGYGADKPTLEIEFIISFGVGREEWGAKAGEKYFVLSILDVKRWGTPKVGSETEALYECACKHIDEVNETFRGRGETERQSRQNTCVPTRARVATKEGCR